MSETRVKIVYLAFILYFCVLTYRLFSLQILNAGEYRQQIELQTEGKISISAKRGEIFSKDGYPLAQNQISYILNFDKNLNTHSDLTKTQKINALVDVLTSDNQVFQTVPADKQKERKNKVTSYINSILLNKKMKAGVIYKKLTEATKNKVEKIKIPELFITAESLRKYPESSMAAHLLGFLGRADDDSLKGYFGLEGYYDMELKGMDGYKTYKRDPLGRSILLEDYYTKDPLDGRSLKTALDRGAQIIIEKWLSWGVKQYHAKAGSVILYDPYRGEILALANTPSFNPNLYYLFSDDNERNLIISDEYETGSIMKPLVMAMAIQEKLINPETKCPKCAGPRAISGYLIKTFDDSYLSGLTMHEVLERSDNTGMTYVGELLGKKRLLNYFEKLGFGRKTGIDLEGEADGFIKNEKDIYDIDQATMTFGQGISVTSIQMVKAYGALVTGKTYKPHVVTAFVSNKSEDFVPPTVDENVYSREVLKTIAAMLVGVTEKSPLRFARDRFPNLKNYKIAAKSGTAQIPLKGKYDENRTIGTVVGFAPAYSPKFILFVKLDEPQANIWGANTAGPTFFHMMNDLLLYYNIPPQ